MPNYMLTPSAPEVDPAERAWTKAASGGRQTMTPPPRPHARFAWSAKIEGLAWW